MANASSTNPWVRNWEKQSDLEETEGAPTLIKLVESLKETGTGYKEQLEQDERKRKEGDIGYPQAITRGITSTAGATTGLLTDVLDAAWRPFVPNRIDVPAGEPAGWPLALGPPVFRTETFYPEKGVDSLLKQGGEFIAENIVSPIVEAIEDTPVAEYLQENYPEVTDTSLRVAGTAADIAGLRFARKSVNPTILNMNTRVENFYSNHQPTKKVKGIIKGLAKGATRAFWAGISPRDQAIF